VFFMPVEHKTATFKRWIPVFAGLAMSFCTFLVHSSSSSETQSLHGMPVAELPPEGQITYQLIRKGGPFHYEKDGIVFGNRERILPRQARGYYREYTVKTPGSRDRGARRIVCGGEEPVKPVACYYTADHYASFRVIVDKN
jgi:ribonuclease T1